LELESRIPRDDATEMARVDVRTECDGEPHGDLAVPEAGRFVDHKDTPHQVCALGRARLQQVLRGHERRHVRNVDVLGGHRKQTVDACQSPVNSRPQCAFGSCLVVRAVPECAQGDNRASLRNPYEEATRARCINHAPVTATAAPATASAATCSPRSVTPSSSATGAIRKLVADARVAPTRPVATVSKTYATPVPSAPSAINDSSGSGDQCARARSGMPSGAVSTSATACARQITGNAPLRCCSGPATLSATP